MTKAQRLKLERMVSRWRADEKWCACHLTDDEVYSNKTEVVRNLGTAIAYADAELAGRAAIASRAKED